MGRVRVNHARSKSSDLTIPEILTGTLVCVSQVLLKSETRQEASVLVPVEMRVCSGDENWFGEVDVSEAFP